MCVLLSRSTCTLAIDFAARARHQAPRSDDDLIGSALVAGAQLLEQADARNSGSSSGCGLTVLLVNEGNQSRQAKLDKAKATLTVVPIKADGARESI